MVESPQYSIKSMQGRMVVVAAILASSMIFLLSSSITIALPAIQAGFVADLSELQWVVNAEALTLAALLLTSGVLGDRFGRKRILSLGIVLFLAGSLLAAQAQTVYQLIVIQVGVGVGAALMIPGSLALINASILESERGTAIGLWSGMSAAVATLGPFLGGWLVAMYDWQSIFYINLPIGILTLWLIFSFVPESRNSQANQIDWHGTIWLIVGLFGICFGLIQSPHMGLQHPLILSSMAGGIMAIGFFFWIECHTTSPIIPKALFKNPLVTGANLVTFFLYFALYGLLFFLVINLQQFQEYSPIAAGASLIPPMLLISIFSGFSGRLADKIGPRIPMILGPLMVMLGMVLLIVPDLQARYWEYLPGLICFGGGMALVIPALTKSALAVEQQYSGIASAINNTTSRIAALMAIAILGTLMLFLFTEQLQASLQQSSISTSKIRIILEQVHRLGEIAIPPTFNPQDHQQAQEFIHSAFLYGFRWIMTINAGLALLSALVAFFLIRPVDQKD